MPKKNNTPGLKLRGNVYYIRIRVPAAYADVEPRNEVFRSLNTSDLHEAQAKCANARLALRVEWDAARAAQKADVRAVFDTSTELLRSWGMSFSPMTDLLTGEIDELLRRIEKDCQRRSCIPRRARNPWSGRSPGPHSGRDGRANVRTEGSRDPS
ncbi:DUF6538 domain-containing protein [Loktanella sp. M215]|uniref:DUF6538 domain-containing protein n=1 Tax=Loktanella sp. M215 TaxID=2675431 RepID=UPI003FA60DA2